MAAQYGVQAFHFYLIGAIPAMVFLAIWMMPVYSRSHVRSIPQYLQLRYGTNVRLMNACVLAIVMLLLAGISLYAMAQVLGVVLGFHPDQSRHISTQNNLSAIASFGSGRFSLKTASCCRRTRFSSSRSRRE
jgi:Na+/proline symporter